MAAVPDQIAAARIQQLEATLYAAEKRNGELARQIDLLNAENDRLRDSEATLSSEAQTMRLQLAGLLPVEEDA